MGAWVWFLDRVLPGLCIWVPTFVVGTWLQTRHLKQHVTDETARQTAQLAEQAPDTDTHDG